MSAFSVVCSLLVIATLTPSISSQNININTVTNTGNRQCLITATDCNTVNNVCGQIPGTLTCQTFLNECGRQSNNCFQGITLPVAATFCNGIIVGSQGPCVGMTAANNPNPITVQTCTTANCNTIKYVCGYRLGTPLCTIFDNLCELQNANCGKTKFNQVASSFCGNSIVGSSYLCNGNPSNSGSSSSSGYSSNTNINTVNG